MKRTIFIIICLLNLQTLLFTEEVDIMFDCANQLFDSQEYSFAKQKYIELINKYPLSKYAEESQYKIGECLERQGNYFFAIDEFEKFVKKYPQSALVYKAKENIDNLLYITQNWEPPVITDQERLCNAYIDRGNYHSNRCLIWSYGRLFNEAELEKALYYYNKAIDYSKDKDIAYKYENKTLAQYTKNNLTAKAMYLKGDLYMKLFNQDTYEKYMNRTRTKDIEFCKKAISEYKKITENYPWTYWANQSLIRIGDIYAENLRDTQTAVIIFKELIKKKNYDISDFYVNYSSARINYIEKIYPEEEMLIQRTFHDWGQRLLDTDEHLANKYVDLANNFLGRAVRKGEFGIVYSQEELDAGMYYLKEAIKLAGKSYVGARAQFSMGEAYLKMERQADYENAIKEFQKVVDEYPDYYWTDQAMVKIGDIYKDFIRDKNKAIEAYKNIIKKRNADPWNYFVEYAIAQIKFLGGSLKFLDELQKNK